jgi:hypothetical protein
MRDYEAILPTFRNTKIIKRQDPVSKSEQHKRDSTDLCTLCP